MPRRRKKSTQQRKPSLIFTESPVNIQHHVPTPVYGAQHPPTAKSVPVDELDVSWVSPQFRRVPADGHGRRRNVPLRRKSHSGIGNLRTRNKSGDLSNSAKSKFKPLKFLGEQTSVLSNVEDVDISFDTDTATDVEKENDISTSESYAGSDIDLSRGQTKRKLRSRSVKEGNSFHAEIQRHNDRKGMVGNPKTRDTDTVESDILPSLQYNVEDNRFTQICVKDKDPPVKRLFGAASNIRMLHFSDSDISLSQDSDTEAPEKERLVHKMLGSSSVMNTPERNLRNSTVLVADTPEPEYGMKLRKRQIKQIRRKDLLSTK